MAATLETESLLTEPELALALRAAVWVALNAASGIRTGWGLGSGALGPGAARPQKRADVWEVLPRGCAPRTHDALIHMGMAPVMWPVLLFFTNSKYRLGPVSTHAV